MQLTIHQRHLKFVLEIAHRPQSAHDDGGPDALGELGEQAIEGLERNPRIIAYSGPKHLQPLLDREQRLLHYVDCHRHDELVGKGQAAADEVLMALRRWIERAGVDRNASHGAWQKVMAVSP